MPKSHKENSVPALKPPSHPKLHCFLARQAYTAVVLYRRRGKETWVFKITYANKDGSPKTRVEKGARFNGRFYPSRCDLSPDGKHFSYFVMGGYQKIKNKSKQLYCWNAISRPPALTAEFLLPQHDTWGGGSIFYDNHNLFVSPGMYSTEEELEKIHGKNWHGVTVWTPRRTLPMPAEFEGKSPMPDGWEGNMAKNMVDGEWTKRMNRCVLTRRYGDNWMKEGYYSAFEYMLTDLDGVLLLNDQMQDILWADFDLLGRLWLAKGSRLEIFNKTKKGISEKSNKVIDLEDYL